MFPHPTVTVPSFSMRASVASGWFCIPAKHVSYVQPTRVFALSKHAERLSGGKSKIGKGSDLEPCVSLFATQQKRSQVRGRGVTLSSPMAFLRGSKAWRTTWPRCCAFRAAFKWGECFQAQKKLLVSSPPA